MKPAPNPRYAAFLAELKTIRRPFPQPFGTAKPGGGLAYAEFAIGYNSNNLKEIPVDLQALTSCDRQA